MKIAIIGSGYVGLVTGVCLADIGNEVVCIDIDAGKIADMQAGKIPIYEPGLEEIFQRNIAASRLHFTTELAVGVRETAVIFLALPTPSSTDGSADLSAVFTVASELGPLLKSYTVIVDKSTVPVGTTQRLRAKIAANATAAFDVVSNPEFLREGFAVSDFMQPDRIVIGTTSEKAREVMRQVYLAIAGEERPLYFMDEASAEMTKYAANSFLATKISFMNEIANICELVGADVDAVRQAMGADSRIGRRFLAAGIGYGGSCFPKDVRALQSTAADHGYDFNLLNAVLAVNARQQHALIDKLNEYHGDSLTGKHFALWGLAFKPNTDDIREAPSLTMIGALLAAGATVAAYDPEGQSNTAKLYRGQPGLTLAKDAYSALDNADALLIATEWAVFKEADLKQIKKRLKRPTIFDGRNIYDPAVMQQAGFDYLSIGRKPVRAATAQQ